MKLNLKINLSAAGKVEKEIISKTKNDNLYYENCKNECNQISNNIFLSNYKTACNKDYLVNNEITHIINSAAKSNSYTPIYFNEICYLTINAQDDPGYDIISIFYKCIEFLENCSKTGTKVLIHCYEGISRGPAIVISYLMWKYKYSFETAYNLVKMKRPCIDINIGFLSQLKKWEETLILNHKDHVYSIGMDKSFKVFFNGIIKLKDFRTSNIVVFVNECFLYKVAFEDENMNQLDVVNANNIINHIFNNQNLIEKACIISRNTIYEFISDENMEFNAEELFNCFF